MNGEGLGHVNDGQSHQWTRPCVRTTPRDAVQIAEEQKQWKTAEQCTAHAARKAREAEALAREAEMLAEEAARAKEASNRAAQAAVHHTAVPCPPAASCVSSALRVYVM